MIGGSRTITAHRRWAHRLHRHALKSAAGAALLVAVGITSTAAAATTVAVAPDHTLAVTEEGTIWAWGRNHRGQLGSSVSGTTHQPSPVPGTEDMAAVAAGKSFSVALDIHGAVWTWGANEEGQMGDGTTMDQPRPARVSGLPHIVAIAAGPNHVVALGIDGEVWTWGAGQLVPHRILDLPPLIRIAAAPTGSLGVTSDGRAWWWAAGEPHPNRQDELDDSTIFGGLGPGTIFCVRDGALHLFGRTGGKGDLLRMEVAVRSAAAVDQWLVIVGEDGSLWTRSAAGDAAPDSVRVSDLDGIVAVSSASDRILAVQWGGGLWSWSARTAETVRVAMPPVMWRTEAPEFLPPEGELPWPRHITVVSETPGSQIRVTTDGSTPELDDPVLERGATVRVDGDMHVSARAWADHLEPSRVASARYQVAFAPHAASGTDRQLWQRHRNEQQRVKTDMIFADGFETGDLSRWTSFQPPPTEPLGAPLISPGSGTYVSSLSVTVTCPVPGAVVRYSATGEPTVGDPVVACGATIEITGSTTLRVRAWAVGFLPSAVTAATYMLQLGTTATPVFDPPGGSYSDPQVVSISCPTPGATIRYTTDGTDPGFTSPVYGAPVDVATTTRLRARAFRRDHAPSAVASATYQVGDATGAPVLSPGSGTYPSGLEVTVSNTDPGATIRYTTDGTNPGVDDPVIADGASITVDRSMRIKAKAWAEGLDASVVTTADYEIAGAVAAGQHHSLALRYDGTVWAWGENQSGECGTGDDQTNSYLEPQQVVGLTEVVAIDAGSLHSLALRSDGMVWAWGWGFKNRIGDGFRTNRYAPVQVLTESGVLQNISAISGGYAHSLALTDDGTVWGWGDNYKGQLGIDTGDSTKSKAVPVPGLTGVTAIAAGGNHSLALKTDGEATGSLWAWGDNSNGAVGDGTTTQRRAPVKVLDGVRSICAGGYHTIVVMADGTVLGTGLNERGQLGTGDTDGPLVSFQPVLGQADDLIACTASGVHTLALTAQRTVVGTGHNNLGQVGDGTIENRVSPIDVVLLREVAQVVAGFRMGSHFSGYHAHSIAFTSDGRVWCWGANNRGQLGMGEGVNDARYRPQPVPDFNLSDRTWPESDPDGDGLSTERELELGTDPFNADTNGDGIDDLTATRTGLDPLDSDMDGDGITNPAERDRGTDPLRADSDEDGVDDAADCFPLDPSRSQCPEPVPGDTEPPNITLIEPSNAVLISTVP